MPRGAYHHEWDTRDYLELILSSTAHLDDKTTNMILDNYVNADDERELLDYIANVQYTKDYQGTSEALLRDVMEVHNLSQDLIVDLRITQILEDAFNLDRIKFNNRLNVGYYDMSYEEQVRYDDWYEQYKK